MRDLFFEMYGTGIEWTICCLLFLLIGVIILIVSLVKLKKKTKIAGIIVSALLIWQIVPSFFWNLSVSRYVVHDKQLTFTYRDNYKRDIKYLNIAAKLALIPWQKGIILCNIADRYATFKEGPEAIKYYNKAYKYIKTYKYQTWSITTPIVYDAAGDTNIAIRITEEKKIYPLMTMFYIAMDDLESAMKFANKEIEYSNLQNYVGYIGYTQRAYINYRLGNRDAELADYQKALSLAKDEKQKKYVTEYRQLRDKELARKKQAAINMGFVKE